MSPAPSPSRGGEALIEDYSQGWDAMMRLVSQGHSWSGHERHVFYMNDRSGTFANASYVSGLDFSDDGRAVGLVDWDQDGDLDLWMRNRTAPRLRLLRNTQGQKMPSLTVTLEGDAESTNRDAIGAVVECLLESGPPIVRSLQAGDLFMSQSSKSLHFGVGEQSAIKEVRVMWPGRGTWESFGSLASGTHQHLRQGSGSSEERPKRIGVGSGLAQGAIEAKPDRAQARALFPARVPLFPSFHYRDQALQPVSLPTAQQGRLLVFWSSACLRCRGELDQLGKAQQKLEKAGVRVLGLCVDALEDSSDAYALMDELEWPFDWGFVEEAVLEKLDHFQHALFDRAVPLSVPLALLVDGEQQVLACYRGSMLVDDVVADYQALVSASDEALHHLAPPMAGRWFTNPVPRVFVAENLARRFEERFPEEALPYLHLAFTQATGEKRESVRRELGARHQRLAQARAEAGRPNEAASLFERALLYTPEAAALNHNFGVFLARHGDWDRAEALLKKARALAPNAKATEEALRMVRDARNGNGDP